MAFFCLELDTVSRILKKSVHSLPPPALTDIEVTPTEIEVLIALAVLCTSSLEVQDQRNPFIAFFSILYINDILLYIIY